MKMGDVIGGYVLTTDPKEGGGHSEWAFARKDKAEFFIKRFLTPTYPVPGAPGSEKTKADRRKRCEVFEQQQRHVMKKLFPISGEGGNLVITKGFFRHGSHYYKVTAKVDDSGVGPKQVALMSRDDRILIMLTAAKSLDTLHKAGLVHGDVKPENLLIKALSTGRHAVKVIDFDNCFPTIQPPAPDQLVGDPAYYSPELYQYNIGKLDGDQLNDKTDVFALGLVFYEYTVGARPVMPAGRAYPAEVVQGGSTIALPGSVRDRSLADLIQAMLDKAPERRPGMGEVHSALKLARRLKPDERPGGSARGKPRLGTLRDRWLGPRFGAAAPAPGSVVVAPGFVVPSPAKPAAVESVAEVPADVVPPAPESEAPTGELKGRLAKKATDAAKAEEKTVEGRLHGRLLKRKK